MEGTRVSVNQLKTIGDKRYTCKRTDAKDETKIEASEVVGKMAPSLIPSFELENEMRGGKPCEYETGDGESQLLEVDERFDDPSAQVRVKCRLSSAGHSYIYVEGREACLSWTRRSEPWDRLHGPHIRLHPPLENGDRRERGGLALLRGVGRRLRPANHPMSHKRRLFIRLSGD